jgi:hypothetical protein
MSAAGEAKFVQCRSKYKMGALPFMIISEPLWIFDIIDRNFVNVR